MAEHNGREDLPADSGPSTDPPPLNGPKASRQRAAIAERPAARPQPPRVDHLPPFKVLLHNDDVNDMGFVLQSLIELTPLHLAAAVKVMEHAHEEGVALVLVTHRERAELYCEQFATKGLCATTEPA
ncbi:MAG: ATP-dependent Clp protease adaptor ClpS [Phycisphaerales bacterium]